MTTRRLTRRLKPRRNTVSKSLDEQLLEIARKTGQVCPTCGYYINPQGCCNPACKDYSGVPF